jgi:hypothetical protein
MWIWLDLAVLLAGGITVGWHAHLWFCKRRHGCPVWLEEDARAWNPKAELNGWHRRRKKPPLDKAKESGAPLERMETPVTGIANPKRKTTP